MRFKERTCGVCLDAFAPKSPRQLYCRPECVREATKRRRVRYVQRQKARAA